MEINGGRAAKQKLVLGTHTSEGEQNYLMLAEVQLPTQDSEIDANGYDEEHGEVGGYGAAAGKVQVCLYLSEIFHAEVNDNQERYKRPLHKGMPGVQGTTDNSCLGVQSVAPESFASLANR